MPWLVQNALLAVFLGAWSVFWISLALFLTVMTFSRNVALVMARRFYAPALIWASGARLEVEPLPSHDWARPHIFLMNHQSMLDIACAFAVLPVNLRFIAKHTLKYVPFLGWYMWATGMVFIDRSRRKSAFRSLAAAGQRIREGANILAYPEGTRSRDGRILPFKKGVFMLALEAGVPVVPVAIEGSGQVVPADSFRVRPGVVRMKVGAPISTSGKTIEGLMGEVRTQLCALHKEMGGKGGVEDSLRS
jgi:1-acyl-sn-glycerol-3-phosphate acyltransferase